MFVASRRVALYHTSPMRRAAAAVILLSLSGCSLVDQLFTTPDSAKIAGLANEFFFWSEQYQASCGGEHAPLACDAAYVALLKVKADLERANEALKRGGAITLQMRRAKADIRSLSRVIPR